MSQLELTRQETDHKCKLKEFSMNLDLNLNVNGQVRVSVQDQV